MMALLVQKMTDTNKFRGRGHCTQPSNVQEDICEGASVRYFWLICKQFILVYGHRSSCIPQVDKLCFLHMWHYLFKTQNLNQFNTTPLLVDVVYFHHLICLFLSLFTKMKYGPKV